MNTFPEPREDAAPAFPRAEVDLHCHLLPAWDDGPRNLDESLALARRASEAGIRTIVVTPHVGRIFGDRDERLASDIAGAVAELSREMEAAQIPITLVPGAEVTLDCPDLASRLRDDAALTVGGQGRYILIESSSFSWPSFADQILHHIAHAGLTPIVAHPERYGEIQQDPSRLADAVRAGALLQITARTLVPDDKSRAAKTARKLAEKGMIGLVASDSHSARGVWPGEVAEPLMHLVGASAARQILLDNPAAILQSRNAATPDVTPLSGSVSGIRGLLSRWWPGQG